jgi:hypothetical protein
MYSYLIPFPHSNPREQQSGPSLPANNVSTIKLTSCKIVYEYPFTEFLSFYIEFYLETSAFYLKLVVLGRATHPCASRTRLFRLINMQNMSLCAPPLTITASLSSPKK